MLNNCDNTRIDEELKILGEIIMRRKTCYCGRPIEYDVSKVKTKKVHYRCECGAEFIGVK
jgi:predicted SprT family Zn-dependent metalloprotease